MQREPPSARPPHHGRVVGANPPPQSLEHRLGALDPSGSRVITSRAGSCSGEPRPTTGSQVALGEDPAQHRSPSAEEAAAGLLSSGRSACTVARRWRRRKRAPYARTGRPHAGTGTGSTLLIRQAAVSPSDRLQPRAAWRIALRPTITPKRTPPERRGEPPACRSWAREVDDRRAEVGRIPAPTDRCAAHAPPCTGRRPRTRVLGHGG